MAETFTVNNEKWARGLSQMSLPVVLTLHSNRKAENIIYIMLDAIDYYEEDSGGSSWIYLRGGNAVNVIESPQAITNILRRISLGV